MIDRTIGAIVLDWDAATGLVGRSGVAKLRRRVATLCAAGAHVGVDSRGDLDDFEAQTILRAAEPGSLWLIPNAGADALGELLHLLEARGIGAGLVLVIGERLRCGINVDRLVVRPAGAALALMDEQIRRRRSRRTPAVDEDPAWIIRESGRDPMRHRITETLFTIGAAGFATRGALEEPTPGSQPLVLAAGVYAGSGSTQHLLPGPLWTGLAIEPAPDDDTRILDLRTGTLTRIEQTGQYPELRTLRFASIAAPGVVALRAEAVAGRLHPGDALRPPKGTSMTTRSLGRRQWAQVDGEPGAAICAVAEQRRGRDGDIQTIERLAVYTTNRRRHSRADEPAELLDLAGGRGFEPLLDDQRAAWAARWDAVDVRIPDDPEAQLAVRFALFQLWCNASRHDELAVGARGLSGTGYSGHVFWDADAFVLPAITSMDPIAARAMVRYRLRRLDAARARARQSGLDGARFPWESAADGTDVTPAAGSLGGQLVPILTGQREDHISADVAWASVHHAEWTGSAALARQLALPLLVDTARYWATRARSDPDGSVHIDNVIGPDEYHESVDDNAYTNVMARWNLSAAATAAQRAGIHRGEAAGWRALAARLVDGYDAQTGRYEQFAGYFDLEPMMIADYAPPPVAADLLLGHDRVIASQLIKQPDVLMLHYLIPDEVHPGSLGPNLDFYDPRTAHGSSLSPSVTAALLARAGRPDEGLAMLRLALSLDIGDTTGMTAAGLHMANLGGVWRAVLAGFAGVSVRAGVLSVDPCLPSAWSTLGIRFRCLGRMVRLAINSDGVTVHTDGPLRARLAGGTVRSVRGSMRLAKPPTGCRSIDRGGR